MVILIAQLTKGKTMRALQTELRNRGLLATAGTHSTLVLATIAPSADGDGAFGHLAAKLARGLQMSGWEIGDKTRNSVSAVIDYNGSHVEFSFESFNNGDSAKFGFKNHGASRTSNDYLIWMRTTSGRPGSGSVPRQAALNFLNNRFLKFVSEFKRRAEHLDVEGLRDFCKRNIAS